jgi:adenine-specific DNA-methyltransferase
MQPVSYAAHEPDSLTALVDIRRREANSKLDLHTKSAHGQYLTPRPVAQFMASLFKTPAMGEVRLLDAGAGVGALTAAFVEEFCRRKTRFHGIAVTAYEIDSVLTDYLQDTFTACQQLCLRARVTFATELLAQDFIAAGAQQLCMGKAPARGFTHAILNPPYKKIHSASTHRLQLRSLGIETSNLYTGFLALVIKLLAPGGELVTITPRSFCNGPYFTPFRHLLLETMALRHIHVFESRTQAFKDDAVLQENIIMYAVKNTPQERVTVSLSHGLDFAHKISRDVDFAQVVSLQDLDRFIHIAAQGDDQHVIERMRTLPCTLQELGLAASTGPVVGFRMQAYLRRDPEPGTVPLISPAHCKDHFVVWPQAESRKPNAIVDAEPVQKWLYPSGYYTLVRRFSAKEERRRVIAAVYDPHEVSGTKIGFENHVNVFHHRRQGLAPDLARGLAVYLSSTFFDRCFRQFNGHTQVNVRDLYNMRYPDIATLKVLGSRVSQHRFPSQDEIDTWIDKACW